MRRNIVRAALEEHRDFAAARPLVDVAGRAAPRVCHLLNRLVANLERHESYLEIGSRRGRTLLSAALGNVGRVCVGCDKHRFYGRDAGFGLAQRRDLQRNIAHYRDGSAHIAFHPTSARRLFAEARLSRPVGIYYFADDVRYAGTYQGVIAASPYLSERSVVIVDGWAEPLVRRAAKRALRDAQLVPLWSRALVSHDDPTAVPSGAWGRGLGVFFVEKGVAALRAFGGEGLASAQRAAMAV
jgi:hypothetical protein